MSTVSEHSNVGMLVMLIVGATLTLGQGETVSFPQPARRPTQ